MKKPARNPMPRLYLSVTHDQERWVLKEATRLQVSASEVMRRIISEAMEREATKAPQARPRQGRAMAGQTAMFEDASP